jgi:hypothetical protein
MAECAESMAAGDRWKFMKYSIGQQKKVVIKYREGYPEIMLLAVDLQ